MKDQNFKKKQYSTPSITTHTFNMSNPDFLIVSTDPDQGEWDPQSDYIIVPTPQKGKA